jgi:hypothetical protein
LGSPLVVRHLKKSMHNCISIMLTLVIGMAGGHTGLMQSYAPACQQLCSVKYSSSNTEFN